jgi:type IV secretory pathway TrbF-like protein
MRERMMNKMQFIFGKTVPSQTTKSGLQNPYVKGAEGRAEWNDRYMTMKQAIQRWQRAFFMAMVVIIIFSIVIAKIAAESKVQPFVVETTNGMPYAVKSMQALSIRDQRLINFAINQFIVNARTIISPDFVINF